MIIHYPVATFVLIERDEKRREETGNGGEIQRFRRNPVCPLARPFSFVCFFFIGIKRLT